MRSSTVQGDYGCKVAVTYTQTQAGSIWLSLDNKLSILQPYIVLYYDIVHNRYNVYFIH